MGLWFIGEAKDSAEVVGLDRGDSYSEVSIFHG